jgi:hypothetical protein
MYCVLYRLINKSVLAYVPLFVLVKRRRACEGNSPSSSAP